MMEAFDLKMMVLELQKQLVEENHMFVEFLRGISEVSDLLSALNDITELLDHAIEQRQWAELGVFLHKTWGEGVRISLQELNVLLALAAQVLEFEHSSTPNVILSRAEGISKDLSMLAQWPQENIIYYDNKLIGRNSDIKAINSMVPREFNGMPVIIPIVGKPGIGKSKLALRVCSELMVSLGLTVDEDKSHWVDMSQIKGPVEFLEILKIENYRNKQLWLVLDGITTIHKGFGRLLKEFLDDIEGENGIVVIVTSSCHPSEVVRILDPLLESIKPYYLRRLPQDESWDLFKSMVFIGDHVNKYKSMSNIAKEICEICEGVPRVIKTVASILYSKDNMEEWEEFRGFMLANKETTMKTITEKLSLDNFSQLPLALKECLTYCSLFPKHHKFFKMDLIHLWVAHGFIEKPIQEDGVEELVGNEYIREFLNYEYFIEDGDGIYKISDLGYELVKHLDKIKCLPVDFTRYFIVVADSPTQATGLLPVDDASTSQGCRLHLDIGAQKLLSLLLLPSKSCEFINIQNLYDILQELEELRALDLGVVNCEIINNFLLKRNLNLRYLRVGLSLINFPEEINEFTNMQTLDLRNSKVKVLPTNFCASMINLRHLYTGETLTDLPPNFGNLKCLLTLDEFIVGNNNGLDALSRLIKLVGKLKIRFQNAYEHNIWNTTQRILKDRNITKLSLVWLPLNPEEATPAKQDVGDRVLAVLHPPATLESLVIQGWREKRLRPWITDHISTWLPNVVYICIGNSQTCQVLPPFSILPHLESLHLWPLSALEYVEDGGDENSAEATYSSTYFPALKYLTLVNLRKLKAWSAVHLQDTRRSFLHILVQFRVSGCPKLTSMPLMPSLESLEADNTHEKLMVQFEPNKNLKAIRFLKVINISIPESFPMGFGRLTTLEKLSLCWHYNLRYLPECIGKLSQLQLLIIRHCPMLTRLALSLGFLPVLQQLEVQGCPRLKEIPRTFSNLRSLKKLEIQDCPKLQRRCESNGEDRVSIQHIPDIIVT